MRWKTGRRSSNIEDRRGAPTLGGLGSGRRLPLRGKSVGGGLGTIVLVLVAMYFGVDPSIFLGGGGGIGLAPTTQTQRPANLSPEQRQLADFVSVVLADTEDTWHAIFKASGDTYEEPALVLFSGSTRSGCGVGEAEMGPFYCPADHKVYIDLSFYEDLKRRHGAPGDFAQAYVIAHEVGHHVQTLLGISPKVQEAKRKVSRTEANQLSVRQELQADCFAGLWANHADRARNILEQGDVEEALTAATAIGDDRLQKQARGYVTPDSFTHGSSEQRVRWFKRGLSEGTLAACNTFKADRL
ncbi:MAG: neutral zinc metallopeptidase [Gammaproteobacteria bacterium]|nr:neutral zinc metallopeptidase [Gammaproteobacteria bacterium]MCP5136513.1 neutral zinc metallopeptidase [Gammaproteobacteria bacterium]